MPGKMLGADPEQLREFAKELQAAGKNLRHTELTLTSVVSNIRWNGPDADNFRRAWSGHKRSIAQIVSGMNDVSASLLRNAQEQEQASSVNSLGPGGFASATSNGASSADVNAAAQQLTDKLDGMTAQERSENLRSEEFKRWAAENPAAAKQAMDAAADSGLIPKNSEEYANFLSDHWNNLAMERMGIDPALWDTSKGTAANWDTIKKVYDFYGQQFLANPDLQWAGMANMIGPSFAGGFQDMAMMRDIARGIVDSPLKYIPNEELQMLRAVANLTDAEIKYYETTMLDMNKEIFLDQGRQHMAYEMGGMAEIDRLRDSGAITPATADAWRDISSGDPERIKHGNTALLDREQNEIISDDYTDMRNRPVTGEAVTWMVTLAGEPSIPGAKSYPEVFPLKYSVETAGPENIPFTHWDNPAQFTAHVTTGLPDGNIANDTDRWKLIERDTLPVYQDLLTNNPDEARRIIGSDFDDRVQQHRPTNNIPHITKRIIDGFGVEIEQ